MECVHPRQQWSQAPRKPCSSHQGEELSGELSGGRMLWRDERMAVLGVPASLLVLLACRRERGL